MSTNKTTLVAVPGRQELLITREFDAPRELVFKAHTDAAIYAQWLGPRDLTTTFTTFEPHSGGSYRFVSTDKDGNEFGFHGVYHEVLYPERMIGTFEFEGLPEAGHVEFDTTRFEELPGGRTRMTILAVYQTVEDRDGMIASGMESGMNQGFDRLDEILAEQVAQAHGA
jgi:uncharacterized protein YndB with AHSA1/START domain